MFGRLHRVIYAAALDDTTGRRVNTPEQVPDKGESDAARRRLLLAWYDRYRRALPWRALPGEAADPYRVWLSETMLQQTRAAAVIPYFLSFVARWPTVGDLAAAPLDDVLHAWQGLGYYARARNLHRTARIVAGDHAGAFPADEAALRALPGIGPYTAAAIAAIAFDRPACPVDGNVERVMARLHGVDEPLPAAKRRLAALAAALAPRRRPGDFAQAVMELGATLCTPRKPGCGRCPLARRCAARLSGAPERLPRRAPKPDRPLRRGVAFWAQRADGALLLRRRPENGLLGGMMELPTTPWRARPWTAAAAIRAAPFPAPWRALPGVVRHGFTHFELELGLMAARAGDAAAGIGDVGSVGGVWCPLDRLGDYALPSLMVKAIRHARAEAAP